MGNEKRAQLNAQGAHKPGGRPRSKAGGAQGARMCSGIPSHVSRVALTRRAVVAAVDLHAPHACSLARRFDFRANIVATDNWDNLGNAA